MLYGDFPRKVPAFFFWRCSLRLNEELDQKAFFFGTSGAFVRPVNMTTSGQPFNEVHHRS